MAKDPYFIEPTNAHAINKSAGTFSPVKMVILIIGIIAALIILVAMILNQGKDPGNESQRLIWRLATLQNMMSLADQYAESPSMQRYNRDAISLLAGRVEAIENAIKAAGYKKTDKEIKKEESQEDKIEELRTAGINGRFNEVYKPMLLQKYSDVIDQLETTGALIKTKEFRSERDDTINILRTLIEKLKNL
ncbi:MAG: hypothetical protein WAW60_03555 [Candidatus Saccharimonadales bacterium]